MNYFKVLGVIFGLVAMLKPVYMHIIPWDENKAIGKAYAEKRPAWLIVVAVIGLLLVGFTWYEYIALDIKYSLVLTLLFSLTLIKAIMLIVDYKKFQTWVTGMLNRNKGKKIVIIDSVVGVFGLIIVVFSLILY